MRRLILKFLSLFFLGFFFLPAISAQAREAYSPIAIKIQFKKTVLKVNEPITGQIVLTNSYPATLPAVFDVQLFQEGKLVTFSTTEIRTVIPGRNRYTLQEFGVPSVVNPGRWRLVISQHGVSKSRTAYASFKVISQ